MRFFLLLLSCVVGLYAGDEIPYRDWIESSPLNIILQNYGLFVVKLIIIISLSIVIYIFRKFTDIILQKYILTMKIFSQYAKDIMKRLYKPFDYLVLSMNINMIIYVYNDFTSIYKVTTAFNMIYSLFFIVIMYKILNAIATLKLSEIDKENSVKNEVINVGIKIANFVILIIGLLFVLHFGGVDLTAVLSGLGIGGLAVAFAAKDTISNFFGTLSILFSNVFSQGDWIVVGKNEGVVVEIGLRVTTIRTFDNALIAIPNGTFATMEVKNWNRRTLGRRIKMNLGITYASKREDIKNAIDEIREMLDKHQGIATENTKYTYRKVHAPKLISKDDYQGIKKTLLVYLDGFGDSSLNILVYCFTKSVNWQEWLEIKEDVMHKIMEILERNSLEFAFPSLSIYNENEI
jgi:MscS family membrane protein